MRTLRLLHDVGSGDSTKWQEQAACRDVEDPDIFFPERGGSSKAARALCADCPVRAECLEYALANHEDFGIWGGTSPRDRRPYWKERADERIA